MYRVIVKRFFLYSLIVTMITSSLSADIDSYLKDLDLDSTRTVLRALNNKFKVNWSLEFKLNNLKRREKTRKVLDCLTFILEERIKKINSLYIQKTLELENSSFDGRLREWFSNKTRIYEEIKTKLAGEWEKSDSEDRYAFECLGYRVSFSEALPTVARTNSTVIADPIIGDIVIVGPAEENLVAYQTSIAEFPPVLPKELGDMVPMSSVPVSGPASSSSMPAQRPLKLSKKYLKSKRKTSKPTVNSSTSINTQEDLKKSHLQQTMQDQEDLLLNLDEKGAKIALQAILNNYLIPFQKFSFDNANDKHEYQHVHAYLNGILQNKVTKATCKLSSADTKDATFASYWYNKKLLEYGGRLEIIWELFQQVSQPQTN